MALALARAQLARCCTGALTRLNWRTRRGDTGAPGARARPVPARGGVPRDCARGQGAGHGARVRAASGVRALADRPERVETEPGLAWGVCFGCPVITAAWPRCNRTWASLRLRLALRRPRPRRPTTAGARPWTPRTAPAPRAPCPQRSWRTLKRRRRRTWPPSGDPGASRAVPDDRGGCWPGSQSPGCRRAGESGPSPSRSHRRSTCSRTRYVSLLGIEEAGWVGTRTQPSDAVGTWKGPTAVRPIPANGHQHGPALDVHARHHGSGAASRRRPRAHGRYVTMLGWRQ